MMDAVILILRIVFFWLFMAGIAGLYVLAVEPGLRWALQGERARRVLRFSFLVAVKVDKTKWEAVALLAGFVPIRLRSTNSPWPYYSEADARKGIAEMRADPDKIHAKWWYD
jgi:hypothetical protein